MNTSEETPIQPTEDDSNINNNTENTDDNIENADSEATEEPIPPLVEKFLLVYPEFDNREIYPINTIEYHLNVGNRRLPCRIWKSEHENAVFLFVAHKLLLSKMIKDNPNNALEMAGGAINSTSKTVGSLSKSVGRDSSGINLGGEGQYSLTVYGRELYQMIRIYGARVFSV